MANHRKPLGAAVALSATNSAVEGVAGQTKFQRRAASNASKVGVIECASDAQQKYEEAPWNTGNSVART
jgi:hypothetical protein